MYDNNKRKKFNYYMLCSLKTYIKINASGFRGIYFGLII